MRIKYPRTAHLPWSPGATSDDVYLIDTSNFHNKEVLINEKMDGENTSIYCNGLHARSIDSAHHASRSHVKRLQAMLAPSIPQGWRLCGENVYACHSICYNELKGYFYLFAIYDENNICLSWDETAEWAELLELPTPEILYRGIWDEASIRKIKIDTNTQEGYVVRLAEAFAYEDFGRSTGKFVRPSHVQTDQHWMHSQVLANGLKNKGGKSS